MNIKIENIRKHADAIQNFLESNYMFHIGNQNEEKRNLGIVEIVKYYNFDGEYNDKNEISSFFYKISGLIYDEIDKIVLKNTSYYKLFMTLLLEYNRYLSGNLVLWSRHQFDEMNETFEEIDDLVLKVLVEKLEENRDDPNIYLLFRQFELNLATHLYGIEFIIERIIQFDNLTTDQKMFEDQFNASVDDLYRILDLAFYLTDVASYKLLYSVGKFKDSTLIFTNEDGFVFPIINESTINLDKEYFDFIRKEKSINTEGVYNSIEVNSVVKKYYGLDLHEFNSVLTNCKRDNLTELFIVNENGLISFISDKTGIDYSSLVKFVDVLTFNPEQCDSYLDISTRTKKVSRKFLFKNEFLYVFPYGLMSNAILSIFIDLSIGESEFDEVSKVILKNLQVQQNDFENKVFSELRKLKNIYAFSNLHHLKLADGRRIIPNQIDGVVFVKNRIIVVECKDIPLKTTLKKASNFSQKVNGEFTYKLDLKIKEVQENKKELILYYGLCCEEFIDAEVIGLFITSSYFNDDQLADRYKIINYEFLSEYFENII